MADKDASKPAVSAAEPPKAVHIGGESFFDRIRPYIKQILIGTIALAVIGTVVWTFGFIKGRKQEAATAKLDDVLEVAQAPIRGKDEKPDAAKDPKKPSFADAKERANAVLAEIDKVGADVTGPAYRGGLLLDAGKTDEAIAEYKKGTGDKTIQGVMCREGLGIALEAKAAAEKDAAARQKGYEEALAAFAAMQPDAQGPRYVYALYHQARIQLLLGKKPEAKALFEKANEANKTIKDGEIGELIEKRLATLGAT